jgi:hypothetical protein
LMHKIIALFLVHKAHVLKKKVHGIYSHTHIHMKSYTYAHEIMDDSTQAQSLAKVFVSHKTKYLNKGFNLVYKK